MAPLKALGLHTRSANVILNEADRLGYDPYDMTWVAEVSDQEWLRTQNCGKRTLMDIRSALFRLDRKRLSDAYSPPG